MTPASPTAAGASKIHLAGARAPRASSILPTCAIHLATSFARCIAANVPTPIPPKVAPLRLQMKSENLRSPTLNLYRLPVWKM